MKTFPLKENIKKVLEGILASPKTSDRVIAKAVGVSQPTVTRIRNRLEELKIIQSYEVIPDLAELGFEIIAFSISPFPYVIDRIKGDSEVVYAVDIGLNKVFTISVHKNYTDYHAFYHKYGVETSYLVPTSVKLMKPLSFKNISL